MFARAGSAIVVALFALTAVAKPFTGTFIADGRPQWMALLVLTQTDGGVTGFLTTVEPNGSGSTRSNTIAVDGSSDAQTLSLRTKTFLNLGGVTFVGHLSGSLLVLSVPSNSGELGSFHFRRGTEEAFNSSLASWHEQLAAAHAQKQRADRLASARAAKARRAQESAADVRNTIRAIASDAQDIERDAKLDRDFADCEKALEDAVHAAAQLDDRSGEETCSYLRSELSYLASELRYLDSQRSYLERGITGVETSLQQLRRTASTLAQQLPAMHTAVAADLTAAVPSKSVQNLDSAARDVLRSLPNFTSEIAQSLRTYRTRADELVTQGKRLYSETAKRVENANCRR